MFFVMEVVEAYQQGFEFHLFIIRGRWPSRRVSSVGGEEAAEFSVVAEDSA